MQQTAPRFWGERISRPPRHNTKDSAGVRKLVEKKAMSDAIHLGYVQGSTWDEFALWYRHPCKQHVKMHVKKRCIHKQPTVHILTRH